MRTWPTDAREEETQQRIRAAVEDERNRCLSIIDELGIEGATPVRMLLRGIWLRIRDGQ